MSENAKTISFVVVGLLAIVIGLATQPKTAELNEETLVGLNLTKDFDSPDDAKRLRITRFDEDTATLRDFEVAEKDGVWSIPSKDDYPADAAAQMAEAATSLMDRKILQVASKNAGDHEQYGVIDPLSPKLEPGQKGVGMRVTMSNAKSEPLADLIVGKAVKDAEGQRYVREAGRDIVYIIEIDRSKLSTNFEDWIEKDLLKLNAWDLQQVEIKDYSAALVQVMTPEGPGIGIDQDARADMTLGYNDADAKWNAIKLRKFEPAAQAGGEKGTYVDFALAEDEELNEKSLNDLKTALDDLQIVDVVRKPQGLSQDLKAGDEFVKNREAMMELMSKGFTPAQSGSGGPQEIVSSDGEVIATMKDGTEYVLRFGNLTNVAGGEKPEDVAAVETPSDPATAAGDAAKKDSDVHRYMFVMARFNENAIKQPEFEAMPDLPKNAAAAAADKPADAAAAEGEAKPATDSATPETPPAEAASEKTESGDEANASDADEKTGDAAAAATDTDEKAADAPAADAPKDKKIDEILAQRKRIEQENKRKQDEYEAARKKGEANVKDLNLRFGDWYFVVNDDVFRKIRLNRENVIKKKEPPQADAVPGAANPAQPAPPVGIPGLPPIPGTQQ